MCAAKKSTKLSIERPGANTYARVRPSIFRRDILNVMIYYYYYQ
jgi:hypothetical protein